MAMKQRPTVFIVGRQKNDKKEPTISKAEIDKRIAKVKTIMRYRDKQEKSKHDLLPIKPPAKQVTTMFNIN